ncbi:hypothetical protein NQ176_g321 [Zarea fungicola]|uniref:Uncharacterized protein n=1 Tax=Zarea fungicola TaxID=93591 RepID=A0ACC1NZV3_9HYPO|nr:hypothetical protein NQ176_g321 [Lecanicillium fungicola]
MKSLTLACLLIGGAVAYENNMATSHDLEPLMQLKNKTENSILIMHPTKDVLELLSQDGKVLGSLDLFDKNQIQDLRHGFSNATTATGGSEKAGELGKRGSFKQAGAHRQ